MRRWVAALIAGPDGAVDEAALFFCAYALLGLASLFILDSLMVFVVVNRGEHFDMMQFAQANSLLLGALGTVGGIIQAFIGVRNKCTVSSSAA
jgi:hypothetical protein